MALLLLGCFDPDLSQKPCKDDTGCPTALGYSCVSGLCSQTTVPGMYDPRPKRVEVEVRPSMGVFSMGTSATDGLNDTPSHLVGTPNPYFLDEREVTVAEYRACMVAKICTAPATGMYGTQNWTCTYGVAGKDQHPVTCVTKLQADAFCTWMGRRLPTEVEWEFAALGFAGNSGQRLVFPNGLGGTACWNMGGSCPVASYPTFKTYLGQVVTASQPGFYDLLGNAWEKTSSPFCTYPSDTCPSEMKLSVRGGSAWDSGDVRFSKATSRLGNLASEYSPNQGFRCARTAP
jgi:formylglycine-generating enzyme required for sulfatase activity